MVDLKAAANAIDAFLAALGRDASREPELRGTGERVAVAFATELLTGYEVDTRALLVGATIPAPAPGLVVVRDVPVVTMCPHHLMPAVGTANVALQARARIVGIGTIATLVDAHARRLALQEEIGEAVVSDLESVLAPEWVACRIVLAHGCMIARGERATGSKVETLASRGVSGERVGSAHAAVGLGR